MAKRRIVWTQKANEDRKQILTYWIERNRSKTYSIKLNKLIKECLRLVAFFPDSGRKTSFDNVRVKNIRDYLLFYEINETEIIVLTIWDGRRDKKSLTIS